MEDLRGFQCRHCRAEFRVARDFVGPLGRRVGFPPVLCCGEPLRPLDPDQVLSLELPRRRIARCPRCDSELDLIVPQAGPLVCLPCQQELLFLTVDGKPDREDKPRTPAPRALEAPR